MAHFLKSAGLLSHRSLKAELEQSMMRMMCRFFLTLWAKKEIRLPLNPSFEAFSLRGDKKGSNSSGVYRPGISPDDKRLLTLKYDYSKLHSCIYKFIDAQYLSF